jgi:hypothetical protein
MKDSVGGGTSGREDGKWRWLRWRWLRWRYMVDGLHILILNRTHKHLAIVLSVAGRGLMERDDGGDLTHVQYEPNQNCHYESPLYNEYIQIKNLLLKKISICPPFSVSNLILSVCKWPISLAHEPTCTLIFSLFSIFPFTIWLIVMVFSWWLFP